jgi:L-lactate utilization protein LutC
MNNPILKKIRCSLGRTAQTPLTPSTALRTSQRPTIYESRQPESLAAEIERFLDEVRKLSGVAQRLTPESVSAALKSLVTENDIRKATLWRTPLFDQLDLENNLRSLGVDLVTPTADKREIALCDLGITEADYLLPETGTLVLTSSAEKPRAVSLLPPIHLAIVHPEMLRPSQKFSLPGFHHRPQPYSGHRIDRHARRAWAEKPARLDVGRLKQPPLLVWRAGVFDRF